MSAEIELTRLDPLDPIFSSPNKVVELPIDPLAKELPTTDVEWQDFERLLLRMGDRVLGLRDVRLYGSRGQSQQGIDVIGIDPDGSAVAIQSKRYQKFTKADFDSAVRKFLDSQFPFEVPHLIIGVACSVTERSIIEELTRLNESDSSLRVEIWDQIRIGELLRDYPEIVIEFFGTATAQRFCYPHAITPIRIPSPDAVATADAVMRGPLRASGIDQELTQARSKSSDEPTKALQLYREVQSKLRNRGFAGHAADLNSEILPVLIRLGHSAEAQTLVMEKLWQAERSGDSLAAQRCERELKGILSAEEDLQDNSSWKAIKWTIEVVVNGLTMPISHEIKLNSETLNNLTTADRARLILFVAESALGDDDLERVLEMTELIQAAASSVKADDLLSTRLLLTVASTDEAWKQLIRAARTTLSREAAALVHARYAHYLVFNGQYDEAVDEWSEAVDNACLAHRNDDATKWLYSQRTIAMRYSGIISDKWHPIAREIAALPSEPRIVTSASRSRETGLAGLNADRLRDAAIHGRRYLRDSIISGAIENERDARSLLGDVYLRSEHPDIAAFQYIYAGQHEHARRAARALGDTYLDVTEQIQSPHQWVAASALHFAEKQADLIPDTQVPSLVNSALKSIEDVAAEARAESFLSPQLGVAAYSFIASVSERLTEEQAQRLIDLLADHVEAEPGTGWQSDEYHVRIMAGIARRHDSLKRVAIEQLLGLFEREPHWFRSDEDELLLDNLDTTGPRLRELAGRTDPPHRYARELLALRDGEKPSQVQLDEARESLQAGTRNTASSFGIGTRAIGDSLVARHLSAKERVECITALLSTVASPYEPAENRKQYLYAAANLADGLPDDARRELFGRAVDLTSEVPASEPDRLHKSMSDPLGFMRWNGSADCRPAAALLAARLAQTPSDQEAVREAAIRLANSVPSGHRDIAQALLLLNSEIVEPLLGALASSSVSEIRCAAVILATRTANDSIALPLASDPEPIVRRALARALRETTNDLPETAEMLTKDPRWSVRRLVEDGQE